jgi:hypothetical protein
MVKPYRKSFGRGGVLTASYEDGSYRWGLSLGHTVIGEITLPNIPDERCVLSYLLRQGAAKIIGPAQKDLRSAPGVIKESIRYLRNHEENEKRKRCSESQQCL